MLHEPPAGVGGRFSGFAAAVSLGGVERPILNDAIKPGNGVVRWLIQPNEFQKRLLNNILGRSGPLSREKHERRTVAVEEFAEKAEVHWR